MRKRLWTAFRSWFGRRFRKSEDVVIELQPRNRLGFVDTDNIERFIARKGITPFLQLHLYPDYFTVFWKGTATVYQVWDCFLAVTREVRKRLDVPIRSGHAQYLAPARMQFPFALERPSDEERRAEEAHKAFLRDHGKATRFARYDAAADLPVILWADLAGDGREIGYSSRGLLPVAIIELIQKTVSVKLEDEEINQLLEELVKRIG